MDEDEAFLIAKESVKQDIGKELQIALHIY